MTRQSRSLLSLFILLLLACNTTIGLVATPTPTPFVPISPTAVFEPLPATTVIAVPTSSPTPVAVPSPSPAEATATPAATLPPGLPAEAILLLSPGPGSRIADSVTVSGVADATFENNLVVELSDVDGNVVGGTPAIINAGPGGRGPFESVVEFTSPAQEAPGRIVVYQVSARDGHLMHLASVAVSLLPSGSAQEISPGSEHPESVVIEAPARLDLISGGSMRVSGFSAPTFEQNLQLAVLDENGITISSGFATIQTEMGTPGPFEGEVSYSVDHEQPGWVQVYATSPRDGGIEHLASVEVILRP